MPARDTWTRDLQLLVALVDAADTDPTGCARPNRVADALGLDQATVTASTRRLLAGNLIETPASAGGLPTRVNAGPFLTPMRPTAEGLERSGAWPTPETGLDRMIAALEAIAVDEHEPEPKRSRARTILGAIGGAGRELGVEITAAVIAAQVA